MQKLLIATRNSGKIKELKTFLSDIPVKIISLKDTKINDEVEEDGSTYWENSAKKAIFFSKKTGLITLSDDGGIEIEALNFEPGVRSRRWLGYEAADEDLIKHMKKISKTLGVNRTAYFRTVITVASPSGEIFQETGEVKGTIAKKPYLKILKGYPFRSFFYLPEIEKYYHESELSDEEQKKYNHRLKAIEKLKPIIRKMLI